MDGDAARLEPARRAPAEVVVGERGEEVARAGEVRELHGGDRAAARGLLPRLARVDDLARPTAAVDARELDPLDMSDNGKLHAPHILRAKSRLMAQMTRRDSPPFERFYRRTATRCSRFCAGCAGRDRAEDAFQETFLRALRAYAKLEHGEHLRAWVHHDRDAGRDGRLRRKGARTRRPRRDRREPAGER